ncbi:MAG TPA: HAD-IC family P-type ATPase, partial [Candidatus Eisenbacteria bacterium]|nr:HAD-IC family P-type ATPase [Candidatus Eisenbacteria bacterium]
VSGVLLGDLLDAAVILAIVVVNAALGFVQEHRAERALARLREITAPTALVVRDGGERQVPAAELVPGDLVVLRTGDRVPADARVYEAHHLAAAEAVLTGEAFPAGKSAEPVDADAPLAERSSMVYMGTTVTAGRGRAVVTATGGATAVGEIAEMLGGATPPTPLQVELARIGRAIGVIALVIVAVVFLLGWSEGYPAETMFLIAVAMAVAAVPEGLPAVITITLAGGVQHLARRQAIVRRLQAVEALGSASVVCTDKTGTLTRNRIHLQVVLLDGLRATPSELPAADRRVGRFAEVAALCNDAPPRGPGGDPIEVALLEALEPLPAPLHADAIRQARPRLDEAAFDPRRKLMSTLHRQAAGETDRLLAPQGAPEAVLARSSTVETGGGPRPLCPGERARLLAEAHSLASGGLRPLALAYRTLAFTPDDLAEAERDLTLVGVVGLSDEPRPEAAPAVEVARRAGIRVVMVTGDHRETARSVARELGIVAGDGQVMPGDRLTRLTAEQLGEEVDRYGVYARVDPADKVKIVRAWQSRGEVVAMTGDGVNDAPALHAADIGVAMGSGTDVSREASEIVLADDNFATLVSAIGEGRTIFDNVRRVIAFLLTTNATEVLVMTLGFLVFGGLGEPLMATQILWINLVTDGPPVLALAADPPDPDRMRRPPERDRSVVGVRQAWSLLWPSCLLAAATLGALVYGHFLA